MSVFQLRDKKKSAIYFSYVLIKDETNFEVDDVPMDIQRRSVIYTRSYMCLIDVETTWRVHVLFVMTSCVLGGI